MHTDIRAVIANTGCGGYVESSVAATTTTAFNPNNVDYEGKQDACTEQCQLATERTYRTVVHPVKNVQGCKDPLPQDCLPRRR